MALKAWLLKRTVMYNFFDYDEGTKHIVIKNMCVYLLWNLSGEGGEGIPKTITCKISIF